MSEYPILPNAPIVEALLDIRVELPDDTDITMLSRVQEPVSDRFPEVQQIPGVEFLFEQGEGEMPELSDRVAKVQGFIFVSPPEQAKVFQARLDGFTFSQLKPYKQWDNFIEEARELWQYYADVARPILVKRLGLRTINRIELPLPLANFSDYLQTLPTLAPNVSSEVSEFFMRVVMPQPNSDVFAIVTIATAPSNNERVLPVIFDIDVYVDGSFNTQSEKMWHKVGTLRNVRNNIFFNSITEATKELFR